MHLLNYGIKNDLIYILDEIYYRKMVLHTTIGALLIIKILGTDTKKKQKQI